jgi:hypothetical protein
MKWVPPLALIVLLFSSPSSAETALHSYVSSAPVSARFNLNMYNTCALRESIEPSKASHRSFDEVERAIAVACKKHILDADRSMIAAKIQADERRRVIEEFAYLALSERRLRFERKPIPGYEPPPEARCFDVQKDVDDIKNCFIEQGRGLVHRSQELPETIALAVETVCQPSILKLEDRFLACMTREQAHTAVENSVVKSMRNLIITAVVQSRAEISVGRDAHRP